VQAFYRPEDIQLGPRAPGAAAAASLTAQAEQILRTRPLARIILDADPPMTVLMLHRDLDQLRLTVGDLIEVNLPPGSLRIFQAR
jgi:hypothetical protein